MRFYLLGIHAEKWGKTVLFIPRSLKFQYSIIFLCWYHCIQLLKIHIISNIHLPIFSTHYLVPEYQWIPQIELVSYSFSRHSVRWNFLWKKVAAPNLFNTATPFIFICNLQNPWKINVPTYAALDTCVRYACLPFCETPGRASRCTVWYLLKIRRSFKERCHTMPKSC